MRDTFVFFQRGKKENVPNRKVQENPQNCKFRTFQGEADPLCIAGKKQRGANIFSLACNPSVSTPIKTISKMFS